MKKNKEKILIMSDPNNMPTVAIEPCDKPLAGYPLQRKKVRCDNSCVINSIVGEDHAYCKCACHVGTLPAIPPSRERRPFDTDSLRNANLYLAEAKRYHDLGQYQNQFRACQVAEEYLDEIDK